MNTGGADSDRHRAILNFLAMTGSSIAGTMVGIVISIYVRRALGPAAIGAVNWNLAVLSYLALIANPGLQIVGSIEVARRPDATARIVTIVTALQLVFGLIAYGFVLILAWIAPMGEGIGRLLIWQGLILLLTAFNLDWALRGHQRMVLASIVAFAVTLAQLPAMLLLVHGPDDTLIYAVLAMPFTLAGAVFNFCYLRTRCAGAIAAVPLDVPLLRVLLRAAWPFAVSQLAILIYWNGGSVILGLAAGEREVGIYSTAARLVFMTTMISGALFNAYLPVLAAVHSNPRAAAERSSEFLGLIAWFGLPMAGLGWACGGHLVELMYGPAFRDTGPYFEWLSLTVGLSFVNIGIGLPLQAWGYQRRLLVINVAAAILNLTVSALLIPRYGGWGAVIAALLAESVVLVLEFRLRARLPFGRHRLAGPLLPPLICSACVAATIRMFPAALAQNWWLMTVCGGLVLMLCAMRFEIHAQRAALRALKFLSAA